MLVTDDDPKIREIVIQRLRLREYDAEGAADGHEAIAKLANGKFDVVVIDLLMPHSSGVDVLDALEKLPSAPPYIVLSGVAKIWRRAHPEKRPAAVLEKPVDFEKLVDAVKRSIRGRE